MPTDMEQPGSQGAVTQGAASQETPETASEKSRMKLSDEEWKRLLPSEVFNVARNRGTEPPWSSPLNHERRTGTFHCTACGNPLFTSDAKFESGCGWPSFVEPLHDHAVEYRHDWSLLPPRVEVRCCRCEAHIGHVFDDGPAPLRKRYCINGVSLSFKPQ